MKVNVKVGLDCIALHCSNVRVRLDLRVGLG